eukprot:924060-Amphidinium_carterae.1
MPVSNCLCRMLCVQRSGTQKGRARSRGWKRSDPESSISTPSPLTPVSPCIGRGNRKLPLCFA